MRIKQLSVAILLSALSFSVFADKKTLDAIKDAGVVLKLADQKALAEAEGDDIIKVVADIVASKALVDDKDGIYKVVKLAVMNSPEKAVAIAVAAAVAAPKYAGEIAKAATEGNPSKAALIAKAVKRAVPEKEREIDQGVSDGRKMAGFFKGYGSANLAGGNLMPPSSGSNGDTNSPASPN